MFEKVGFCAFDDDDLLVQFSFSCNLRTARYFFCRMWYTVLPRSIVFLS
jgi:hypothetical protein